MERKVEKILLIKSFYYLFHHPIFSPMPEPSLQMEPKTKSLTTPKPDWFKNKEFEKMERGNMGKYKIFLSPSFILCVGVLQLDYQIVKGAKNNEMDDCIRHTRFRILLRKDD